MTRIRKLYELQLVDTQIARLETALAALDDGTAMRAQVEQARSAEETARAELQARQSRLRDLTAELEAARRQRGALAAEVDPDFLRRYERLRSRKDGVAVTAVNGSVCNACHMTVPEAVLNAARERDEIRTCEDCGRILYVPVE